MKKLKDLALIILFISGCATAHQLVPPIGNGQMALGECPSDKACIYVIRPAGFLGAALAYAILDGNREIGLTGPRSYLAWQRDPGVVSLTTESENNNEIHFIAQAGQTYYIMQSLAMGMAEARTNFNFISKDQAQIYLKSCRPASGQ